MMRENDAICVKIQTMITFVVRGISEKDTQGGAGSKFVRGDSREIRVTSTAKHAKMVIKRRYMVESLTRSLVVEVFGGVAIEKVSGDMESFYPIHWWHDVLEKKSTHDVIGGADHTLNFSILLRSV